MCVCSDYVWLHERLSSEFPHLNVPPLPAKASMGNLEERFELFNSIIILIVAVVQFHQHEAGDAEQVHESHHQIACHAGSWSRCWPLLTLCVLQLSPGLKVFLTEKFGAEFDNAKKALPAPHEFKATAAAAATLFD